MSLRSLPSDQNEALTPVSIFSALRRRQTSFLIPVHKAYTMHTGPGWMEVRGPLRGTQEVCTKLCR